MATQKKTTAKKASPAKAKPAKEVAAIATPKPEAPMTETPDVPPKLETSAADAEQVAPTEDLPEGPEAETPEPKSEPVEKFCELADKDTGFFDHETGFKVVRDQRIPLGEKVGKATRTAIVSGRLLVVGEK
jgi:hypothetical protein